MEDYTDSYNIRLKNDDYVNFKQYFSPDVALMIRATVNEWSPREEPLKKIYSLRIKMIYMLSDIREKLVKSVNLIMDINRIRPELMDELERFTVQDSGKILKFQLHDPESQMKLKLFSRKKQVLLTDEFMNYLKEGRDFDFRLA